MPSEARSNAARANGAKFRGPKTAEGKSASSKNSLRHGILAKTAVLEGESPEAFIALLTALQEEHQPETPTEEGLIEDMAIARWRRERIRSMETGGLNNQIRHPKYIDDDDIAVQHFTAFRTLTHETRALDLLNRYDARYERQFRNALTSFLNLRARRIAAQPEEHDKPTVITYRWDDNPRPKPDPPTKATPDSPQIDAPEVTEDATEDTAPVAALGSFGDSPIGAACVSGRPSERAFQLPEQPVARHSKSAFSGDASISHAHAVALRWTFPKSLLR
jgi:hypothetical protein